MSHLSCSSTNASSSSGSSKVHSAHAENVHVQSVVQTETQSKVSMENAKKITDLMSRLGKFNKKNIEKEDFDYFISGSTHTQVDEYSRKRTEEISEAVSESIRKIVAETQQHQQQLLADANSRTAGNCTSTWSF
jgi:hypothetical protein